MTRLHLIISGRVQGVGFRYFCQEQAKRLGLTGFVRNCEDGTVEAEVQGEKEIVEKFLTLVSDGPRHAEVNEIRTEDRPLKEERNFQIS